MATAPRRDPREWSVRKHGADDRPELVGMPHATAHHITAAAPDGPGPASDAARDAVGGIVPRRSGTSRARHLDPHGRRGRDRGGEPCSHHARKSSDRPNRDRAHCSVPPARSSSRFCAPRCATALSAGRFNQFNPDPACDLDSGRPRVSDRSRGLSTCLDRRHNVTCVRSG